MESGNGKVLIAPGITIRLFTIDDAAATSDLFRASVRTLAAGDYTPSQLRACAPDSIDVEKFGERCLSKSTWLAEIDDRIAGFSDLEPDGHIDMLYVHPDFARRGVARVLLQWIEEAARASDLRRLYTEASTTARVVFEKAGFRLIVPQTVQFDQLGDARFSVM